MILSADCMICFFFFCFNFFVDDLKGVGTWNWTIKLSREGRWCPVSTGDDSRVSIPSLQFPPVSKHTYHHLPKKKSKHPSMYLYKTCLYLISLVKVSRFVCPKKWKHTQLLHE